MAQGRGSRFLAALGILCSTLMTVVAGSSGPIGTYATGIAGIAAWGIRYRLKLLRWGIVLGVVALELVMNDPVWFIFARIDVFSGSTGWHRANLIDRVISHFGDWWLFGARDIASWGIFAGDTTNQYIAEGIRAGLINMALFISLIGIGCSYLGRAMRAGHSQPKRYQLLVWSAGVGLVAHMVSFFGVSYFDQNIMNFLLTLAIIATVFQRRRDALPFCASRKVEEQLRGPAGFPEPRRQPAFSSIPISSHPDHTLS